MDLFLQQVLNGLMIGSTYAVVAPNISDAEEVAGYVRGLIG